MQSPKQHIAPFCCSITSTLFVNVCTDLKYFCGFKFNTTQLNSLVESPLTTHPCQIYILMMNCLVYHVFVLHGKNTLCYFYHQKKIHIWCQLNFLLFHLFVPFALFGFSFYSYISFALNYLTSCSLYQLFILVLITVSLLSLFLFSFSCQPMQFIHNYYSYYYLL